MDFTVELIVDDVSQGITAGSVAVAFSTATAFIGHGASLHSVNKLVYADDVDVIRGGIGLLSNTGFESAVNAYGLGVSGANWGRFTQNAGAPSTAELITAPLPVHSGSQAGRVLITAGAGDRGAYFFQDVALAPGEPFDLDGWLYIVGPGQIQFRVIFDWDRGGGFISGEATVVAEPGVDTTFDAWGIGGTAPPLPDNQWTHVILRIDTSVAAWVIGDVQLGTAVASGWQ